MARPTKYKKEYNEQAEKLCRLGATDIQLADFFNVTEKTLNNWKHDHPSFLQSLKSKSFSDDLVEQSLYKRAVGYYVEEETEEVDAQGGIKTKKVKKHVADTTAMIYWLNNRKPDKWRAKPKEEGGNNDLVGVLSELISKLPS